MKNCTLSEKCRGSCHNTSSGLQLNLARGERDVSQEPGTFSLDRTVVFWCSLKAETREFRAGTLSDQEATRGFCFRGFPASLLSRLGFWVVTLLRLLLMNWPCRYLSLTPKEVNLLPAAHAWGLAQHEMQQPEHPRQRAARFCQSPATFKRMFREWERKRGGKWASANSLSPGWGQYGTMPRKLSFLIPLDSKFEYKAKTLLIIQLKIVVANRGRG